MDLMQMLRLVGKSKLHEDTRARLLDVYFNLADGATGISFDMWCNDAMDVHTCESFDLSTRKALLKQMISKFSTSCVEPTALKLDAGSTFRAIYHVTHSPMSTDLKASTSELLLENLYSLDTNDCEYDASAMDMDILFPPMSKDSNEVLYDGCAPGVRVLPEQKCLSHISTDAVQERDRRFSVLQASLSNRPTFTSLHRDYEAKVTSKRSAMEPQRDKASRELVNLLQSDPWPNQAVSRERKSPLSHDSGPELNIKPTSSRERSQTPSSKFPSKSQLEPHSDGEDFKVRPLKKRRGRPSKESQLRARMAGSQNNSERTEATLTDEGNHLVVHPQDSSPSVKTYKISLNTDGADDNLLSHSEEVASINDHVLAEVRLTLNSLLENFDQIPSFAALRRKNCVKLLQSLLLDDPSRSLIFWHPVDESVYTDYRVYCEMPKCFQDIANNLHENYYNSYMEFAKDVVLVFRNCMAFNHSKSSIVASAKALLAQAKSLLKQYGPDYLIEDINSL